jgi:hypothetical protein
MKMLSEPGWRNEMRYFRSAAMAFALAVLVFASVGVLSPVLVAAAPCPGSTFSGGKETITFCFTGAAQTWTVPAGVTSATFSVSGAQGGAGGAGGGAAGLGGRAVATRAVAPGSTITIVVGGQGVMPPSPDSCATVGGAGGFNGGAIGGAAPAGGVNCAGSGGGGASDVRIGGNALANRVVVGGGGGGASHDAAGGTGGGTTGGDGAFTGGVNTLGGKGGTQSAGGAPGTSDHNGVAGTSGVGGAGAANDSSGAAGGGGGGGFYGGGGGGGESDTAGGGGGGGSGHGPSGVVFASGVRAGAGIVTVTFARPLPAASASMPSVPWLPIGGLAVGLAMIWFGLRRRRATV